jgi:hypothetical protein
MQREAWPVPFRASTTRWFAYGALVGVAIVAAIPLHHRLWPVSVLALAAIPIAERAAGRTRPRSRTRPSDREPVPSRLAALEGDGFHVLNQIDAGNHRLEQVVVGPTGVFVVHVNTWPGRFFMRRDGWFSHTRGDAGELVWDVTREVMAVKARLRAKRLGTPVQGLVAVTASKMEEPVIHMGRVTFVDAERVVDYVTSRRRSLSPEQVSKAAAGIPA